MVAQSKRRPWPALAATSDPTLAQNSSRNINNSGLHFVTLNLEKIRVITSATGRHVGEMVLSHLADVDVYCLGLFGMKSANIDSDSKYKYAQLLKSYF